MKITFTAFFSSLLLLCFLTTQAQTIRRCNNTGVTGTNVYTTLQAAHDAATNGDIICLEPTSTSYGNLICTKVLTIIGTGYFLTQYPGLQLDASETLVGSVVFDNGSAGSRLTGYVIDNTISIVANNITVERNHFSNVIIGYSSFPVYFRTVNGAIVRNKYTGRVFLYVTTPAPTFSNTTLDSTTIPSNIIYAGISSNGHFISYANFNNILITNNAIGTLEGNSDNGILDIDNAVIQNNILTYTGTSDNFTPRNNAYSHNISANTAFGTANGNQQDVAPAALFVGGAASTDGAFQLRAAPNLVIGTGEDGASKAP